MKKRVQFTIFFLLIFYIACFSQGKNATIRGRILDQNGYPLDMVNIGLKEYPLGTSTNRDGKFLLRIPAKKEIIIIFSSLGHQTHKDTLYALPEENITYNLTMPSVSLNISEITIKHTDNNRRTTSLNPDFLDIIPGSTTVGVEALLKTLPGVSSNNELSSQYTVRGGNFDENLVYVNDIEIYRPFLIRSGQQEGLSFINSDLVSTINFSAGGFNARYGDKMSSVLDIKYRTPSDFRGSATMSFLGATAHFEDIAFKGKLSHISGIRYKTNSYMLRGLDEKGEYNPKYIDFQTYITYLFSNSLSLSFLGIATQNQYQFIPKNRQTSFGTLNTPLKAKIYFEGQEIDIFKTYLGAFIANYHPNLNLNLKFILSSFKTSENESYDISGKYYLNQLERNMATNKFGDSILNLGIGSFLNHARNNLNAVVYNISHRGAYNTERNLLNWGLKLQHEKINDKINEWVYRDSTGYSLPYSDKQVLLFNNFSAKNSISSIRLTGYIQNTINFITNNGNLFFTGGVRFNIWNFNDELLISPRLSISYHPNWENKISFYLSGGMYHQSPFFKELKNSNRTINPNAEAQRSSQLLIGSEYLFSAWERPFIFSLEVYYKHMYKLIPYKVDNVQIHYLAEQQSKGYATGIDMKIHGEFVSGLQSWASISLLKTEEDIINDIYIQNSKLKNPGYIPRPSDQRFTFSLYFQDYLPGNPTYKLHLTGFYGSRIPIGPPNSERYMDIFRIPPYRRIDLGISKALITSLNPLHNKLIKHINSMWISIEIFNLLNIKNTISYFWLSSIHGDQFAVPNYLTDRRINIKLTAKF